MTAASYGYGHDDTMFLGPAAYGYGQGAPIGLLTSLDLGLHIAATLDQPPVTGVGNLTTSLNLGLSLSTELEFIAIPELMARLDQQLGLKATLESVAEIPQLVARLDQQLGLSTTLDPLTIHGLIAKLDQHLSISTGLEAVALAELRAKLRQQLGLSATLAQPEATVQGLATHLGLELRSIVVLQRPSILRVDQFRTPLNWKDFIFVPQGYEPKLIKRAFKDPLLGPVLEVEFAPLEGTKAKLVLVVLAPVEPIEYEFKKFTGAKSLGRL